MRFHSSSENLIPSWCSTVRRSSAWDGFSCCVVRISISRQQTRQALWSEPLQGVQKSAIASAKRSLRPLPSFLCREVHESPPFYPLNYLNSDNSDCRVSIADYEQRERAACPYLRYTGDYTAIQFLVQRQYAICRELFERAIATAFAHFTRHIRRFDQRV